MGEHDVPPRGNHVANVRGRPTHCIVLVLQSGVLTVAYECVTPYGNHCDGFAHRGVFLSPILRANAFTAAVKQAIGAVVTPAPICPTPGSRWAMPLLITGKMPQSTTLRASMPAAAAAKSSAGKVKDGLLPRVIARMRRLWCIASVELPPTNFTMAGAAAIAKPPTPAVSV